MPQAQLHTIIIHVFDICPCFRIRIVHFILTHTPIHSGGEKNLPCVGLISNLMPNLSPFSAPQRVYGIL